MLLFTLSVLLCIRFLCALQYMIPAVAATITTPTMAAIIPIRTTIQKKEQLVISYGLAVEVT